MGIRGMRIRASGSEGSEGKGKTAVRSSRKRGSGRSTRDGYLYLAGLAVLAAGHLLGHVQQQAPVAFIDPAEQPSEDGQEASFLPGIAPGHFVRCFALRQVGQLGRLLAVVE